MTKRRQAVVDAINGYKEYLWTLKQPPKPPAYNPDASLGELTVAEIEEFHLDARGELEAEDVKAMVQEHGLRKP